MKKEMGRSEGRGDLMSYGHVRRTSARAGVVRNSTRSSPKSCFRAPNSTVPDRCVIRVGARDERAEPTEEATSWIGSHVRRTSARAERINTVREQEGLVFCNASS